MDNLRERLPHLTPGTYIPAEYIKGTNGVHRYVAYLDMAAQTTTLTEGVPPTDQSLSINVDEFTAAQKGGTIAISDLAAFQSPHDLISVGADRAAFQAARTMDEIARVLYATDTTAARIVYSGTATSRLTVASSHLLTGQLVKKMVARLGNLNVPRFPDGYYRAIAHPRAIYDLMTDTSNGGWMDVTKYVDNSPLLAGEVGSYGGVKFLESTIATTFATAGASGVDVLRTVFLGPSAIAFTGADSLESYFVPPGGDHSDPIAQLAKVGWKCYIGGTIIVSSGAGPRVQYLESAGTILASGQA